MRYEQPLEKADVIVGFGSSDIRTADWRAQLWHDGWVPRILFSGARGRVTRDTFTENEADVYAKRAQELGVDASSILIENQATNSGENVTQTYELLVEKNAAHSTILLVHKPYMLRRAYATTMRQWPAAEKPKIICSSIDISFSEYCVDEHYPFEHVTNVMVGDMQRIREYPKLGFQIEQDIPNDVWAAYEELVRRGYTQHLLNG